MRKLNKYLSVGKLARLLEKSKIKALRNVCPYENRLYLGLLTIKDNNEVITFDVRGFKFENYKLLVAGVNFTHCAGYTHLFIDTKNVKYMTFTSKY